MGKKVLILSGSPRRNGNSDLLCGEFLRGASDAGNDAEKIFIRDKNINFCTACGTCYLKKQPCVHNDDMPEIIQKMIDADVIVLSTPVYFYAMNGQMKTLLDRTIPRFLEISGKDFYFIAASHDARLESLERVFEGFRGFLACLKDAREKGRIYGTGVWDPGDIKTSPVMNEAYEMGKSV